MQKFSKATESQITDAIVKNFYERFSRNIRSDVIIVGGGSTNPQGSFP